MGKVWISFLHDNNMNADIPRTVNSANAMYGFRELGAEIIPYHSISEIIDQVTEEDIVVDGIFQSEMIFGKFGIKEPNIPYYPSALKEFLGRKIWTDKINSIASDKDKWSAGYFVKPVQEKAFTGKIISSLSDLIGCGNEHEDFDVFVSEPIDILAEWRCFILYDRIIDVRLYGGLSGAEYDGFMYHYDSDVLSKIMEAFITWEERPAACSIDICYTRDGRTLLVECNDAYSLGSYGLHGIFYARMISARWSQLLGREDVYRYISGR
ncbi:MAG: ATP-grasp domain-containing protein [Saccharofermentans sp.]|nr:ATP-grasp domain-containing protein [Saccharofermentans sp.]